MAEIGKECWGQYKRSVLAILRDHLDGLHWKDLLAELGKIMPASRALLPPKSIYHMDLPK
jgi:hypothetical protein